jgi:cyclophilin family peptidyl-prolyl cis-trans isomerase
MFAFFRVSVAGSAPQTIVFKLDNHKCPKTCDNFIAICQSRAKAVRPKSIASSSHTNVEPTYRGTEIHRIVPGFIIQGGDFTRFDGTGGFAVTNGGKPTFADENFDISHDREGILSMANKGKDTNGSQFFITLGPAKHLDGKHCAFGYVVRNMECVKQIAQVETDANGKPVAMQRVVITDCGIGTGDEEPDSDSSSISSSSSSRSESSKKKRRRRSRKSYESSSRKKKKRKKSHSSHRRRDYDEDDDSSRKRKKKSKEKTSHRRREREHDTKKRQKKHDERHDERHRKKRSH